MKWYQKVLVVISVIVASPFVLLGFIVYAVFFPFLQIIDITQYKESQYYKDFKQPYKGTITGSPQYELYNAIKARDLKGEYVRQKSNNFEYFVYNNVVYLFPDNIQFQYEEESKRWNSICRKNKKQAPQDFHAYLEARKSLMDNAEETFPVKLLVARRYIVDNNLDNKIIPQEMVVVKDYERAFDEVEWKYISIVPQNAKELYELLMTTPDLCGEFDLIADEVIHWTYNNLYLEIDVDYISVYKKNKSGKFTYNLTHWHPCNEECYDDVCAITQKGSRLVIKTSLGGGAVLYMGKKQDCPYSESERGLFTKTHYFEIE